MKQSGVETESEAFQGLDDQGSGQQELFGKAAVRSLSAKGSRLIVSCRDAGLANDYGQFLADKSRHESSPAVTEGLSSDAFIHAAMQSQLRPAEVVIFLDRRITREVWKIFSALVHMTERTPFTCLLVLPSLQNHLSPNQNDGMQAILDQLADAFRKGTPAAKTAIFRSTSNSDPGISFDRGSAAVHERPTSRLIVIRTGFVISPSSLMTQKLRRLAGFRKLLVPHLATTFVDGDQLFSTIHTELRRSQVEKHSRFEAASSAGSSSELAAREQDKNGALDEMSQSDTRERPHERDAASSQAAFSTRQVTILGTRRTWQSVITELPPPGRLKKIITLATAILVATGIPWLLYFGFQLLSLLIPSLRQIHFDTLKPRSVREIISLYNRHNCRHVQLAGYNNGVNHFGWKFPEKTVVLTTGLPGKTQLSEASILDLETRIRSSFAGEKAACNETIGQGTAANPEGYAASTGTHFTVDAGLTLHHCIRELNKLDREFYVVPNYSWISMGTLYFVPVHGSGSHVSTLGDTIEDVLLYDGESEKFILSRRGDTTFRNSMYDTSRNLLLLRLTLRVKPKSVY